MLSDLKGYFPSHSRGLGGDSIWWPRAGKNFLANILPSYHWGRLHQSNIFFVGLSNQTSNSRKTSVFHTQSRLILAVSQDLSVVVRPLIPGINSKWTSHVEKIEELWRQTYVGFNLHSWKSSKILGRQEGHKKLIFLETDRSRQNRGIQRLLQFPTWRTSYMQNSGHLSPGLSKMHHLCSQTWSTRQIMEENCVEKMGEKQHKTVWFG